MMGLWAATKLWAATNPRNILLIGGLVAVIAVLAFVYMKGRGDADRKNEARQVVAEQAALKSDTKADGKATAEEVKAAEVRAEKEGKLIDAVAQIPDDTPDAVAVALGCQRLREANISTTDLPACGSPGR